MYKFLKNLTPWRDSNPGSSVLYADAMTTMPRRQCMLDPYLISNDVQPRKINFRCDSPKKLVLSAIRYLKKVEPNPDFILWTGDNSPHWWDEQDRTWSQVYDNMKKVRTATVNVFLHKSTSLNETSFVLRR
jgi:hypothetical protein